jgi:predicted  nucleic acid-binding Zn-ribbon protein
MGWPSALKISLVATCSVGFAGCADFESIRLQLDDLKSQVAKLQNETTRVTAAANAASANATSAAARAQKAVSQVQSETRANATAIAALNDKIDRMFKRPLSKSSSSGQAANSEPMAAPLRDERTTN